MCDSEYQTGYIKNFLNNPCIICGPISGYKILERNTTFLSDSVQVECVTTKKMPFTCSDLHGRRPHWTQLLDEPWLCFLTTHVHIHTLQLLFLPADKNFHLHLTIGSMFHTSTVDLKVQHLVTRHLKDLWSSLNTITS